MILYISHVGFDFGAQINWTSDMNGQMEQNFPFIPIFWNFRATLHGTLYSKISEQNSRKCLFHSLPHPEFHPEWRALFILSLSF